MQDARDIVTTAFRGVQDRICDFLVGEDQAYREDAWTYASGAGGGITRIWEGGPLLEKGGVGFSAIEGTSLPPSAATQFKIPPGTPFYATGVSLVMHPRNPHVPTIHMNIRYFQAGEVSWFGGGMDLTPYYPEESQVVGFHRALRDLCNRHGRDYTAFKRACDEYFVLKHRGEARGVGGLFFDHLQNGQEQDLAFTEALGLAFPDLYRPFLSARDRPVTEKERDFQLYRRSRYVEFNLLWDRGTLFGLQSGGRTESILMSMPPLAKWVYGFQPEPGSPEERLTGYFLKPRDWAGPA
ncbi:MAG: putative coproporphyrinogen oxidase, aerobic [Fibrobacteres bacterium]|nr:putative coproporphyrinogen oxidase, aerobic [Fibrobacterota bacterium]